MQRAADLLEVLMAKRCPWIHDHRPRTYHEECCLRANRGTMTARAMAAALPGRTQQAVQSRCSQLGIFKRDLRPPEPETAVRSNKRHWAGAEIAVLRRHARSGPTYIHRWHLPHRSQDAIGQMISRLRRQSQPPPADLEVAA